MTALIAADIGGTRARFALARVAGGKVAELGDPVVLVTDDYAGLDGALAAFAKQAAEPLPRALALSFAGPVDAPTLRLTNSPWILHPDRMRAELGLDALTIVNDFGAMAHAVATLGAGDFRHLTGPDNPLPAEGVVTILGPGTGLGVAALLRRSAADHDILETEGGHIDFAPLDVIEDRILVTLRRTHRRVSVERIVSGGGLANLYRALSEAEGTPATLTDEKMLWAAAAEGSDRLAAMALDRFCRSLGSVAGDLALAHGAEAVVIAGGLANRIADQLAASDFATRFTAKGRFEARMAAIPVKLMTHPQPGLYGAAAAFAQMHR